MDNVELEGRPRQPLMLKEWLELEYSAELSRDGFGCYPRHLATEPRSAAGCRRRRNGHDVIARVSAAVRAALSRPPPSARQGEAAAALPRSLSTTRLRVVGFWKKRSGEMMEETDTPVASCSATAASSGRRDGASSLATSPRRMGLGRESRQAGGDRVGGLSGGRRSHETVAECEAAEAACHLDEEREHQEQRLSPVSVMDFQSQDGDGDGDDDCNDNGGCCNGHREDEGTPSPTFERSLANIRRASQQLLQRIRRFERLAELDTSDMDNAAMTADDMSCHVGELDSVEDDEDAKCGPVQEDLQGLPRAGSLCPAPHCFKKLLEDFFREGLSPCHAVGWSDDSELEMSLLETAKAWLDGRHCTLRSDLKAEVEEMERLGWWRRFREDEHELLSSDVEGDIFFYLMEELVEDLC